MINDDITITDEYEIDASRTILEDDLLQAAGTGGMFRSGQAAGTGGMLWNGQAAGTGGMLWNGQAAGSGGTAGDKPDRPDSGQNVQPGETLQPGLQGGRIGTFRIVRQLPAGGQAKVYLAERDGKQYVAKVYGRNWQPVRALRLFFLQNPHENVMPVIDSGRQLGSYYEIYPYYQEGTLEDLVKKSGALSVEEIRKTVVPSVNEGLRHLHTHGIVHCDIKPSNLYMDSDKTRIVIGDLGSCRMMDSDGMVRSTLEGTIHYSVPVQEFYGVKIFPKEYDYASLGITLYRLYSGSHLMEDLELTEMARLWDRDAVIPVEDVKLRNLLAGLIQKDFSKVWGYEELARWSATGWNSDKKKRMAPARKKKTIPLVFGMIRGEVLRVDSVHGLVEACKQNWEIAVTVIRRYDTRQFVRQFDPELARQMEGELRYPDENAALFRVLYLLEKTGRICYRGRDFGSLDGMIRQLQAEDPLAVEFVTQGLLVYYLRLMDADPGDVARLEKLIQQNRSSLSGQLGMIDAVCSAFLKGRSLALGGQQIDSLDHFVDVIAQMHPAQIDALLGRKEVQSWLSAMGFGQEMQLMQGASETETEA